MNEEPHDIVLEFNFGPAKTPGAFLVQATTFKKDTDEVGYAGHFEGDVEACAGATIQLWTDHHALQRLGLVGEMRTNMRCDRSFKETPEAQQYFRIISTYLAEHGSGKIVEGEEMFGRLQ